MATPATPALDHAREEGLQLERLGRRLARREPLLADPILDGADQAGRAAPGAQEGVDEDRRRRLAVRAGDPDHGERARGMAEVGVGQPGERLARGRDEDAAGLAAREHVGPVEDHRGGAAAERVGDEASPVLLEPGNGDEELARRDLPRVVGEAAAAPAARRPAPSCPAGPRGASAVGTGSSRLMARAAGEASARRQQGARRKRRAGGRRLAARRSRGRSTSSRTSSGASTSSAWRSDSPCTPRHERRRFVADAQRLDGRAVEAERGGAWR